jgi:hypothetical protein
VNPAFAEVEFQQIRRSTEEKRPPRPFIGFVKGPGKVQCKPCVLVVSCVSNRFFFIQGAQIDTSNCRACEKPVFQMEQIKAEKGVWHKNCFRCTECNKQLKSVALTLPRPNIETCSVPVSTHIRAMKAASTASPISKPYSHRKPSKTTPPVS